MGQVQIEVSAEEARAVQAFLRVVDSQSKVEEKFRGIKHESKGATEAVEQLGDAAKHIGADIVGGIEPALMKFTSIGGAIEGAFELVKKGIEAAKERAHELKLEMDGLYHSAALAGQLKLLPQLEEMAGNIKSDKVSNEQKQQMLGGLMMDFSGRLDAKGYEEALKFGVQAQQGGGDGGVAAKTFATFREAFKGSSAEEVSQAAGRFLGQDFKAPDEGASKFLKEGAASKKSLTDVTNLLMAIRGSGESGKTVMRAMDEASEEIDPESIKPHKEKAKAVQAEIDQLKERKLTIDRQKAALDEEERPHEGHHIKKAREEKKKELEKQEKQIELRSRELELMPETETFSDKQKRQLALSKFSSEERAFKVFDDASLADPKHATAFANIRSKMAELRGAPPTNIIEKNLRETAELESEDSKFRKSQDITRQETITANQAQGRRTERDLQTDLVAKEIFNNAAYGTKNLQEGLYRAGRFFHLPRIPLGEGSSPNVDPSAPIGAGTKDAIEKHLEKIADHTAETKNNTKPRGNSYSRGGSPGTEGNE